MKKHILDYRNMVCSCGKAREQHLNLELKIEKIKEFRFSKKYSIEKEFEMVDDILKK